MLDNTGDPQAIEPYACISFPHAISSAAVYPGFKLAEYNGAMVATSLSDHPIQLFNIHRHAISSDSETEPSLPKVSASYPLPNPNTEAMDAALALEFPSLDKLLVGTTRQRGRVALFDLNRPGSRPVNNIAVKQKCKPIVSAIAPMPATEESADSPSWSMVTAVGYYAGGPSLSCNLYDFRTREIVSSSAASVSKEFSSNGVTQLIWSKNGRFVFVLSRQSTTIPVLDARMGFAQVATLGGYKGMTNQRLSACIAVFHSSQYLFTGSTDGTVCRYDDKALMGMDCDRPLDSWQAHGSESNISSVSANPLTEVDRDLPLVLASACGQRATMDDTADFSNKECSIKLWSL